MKKRDQILRRPNLGCVWRECLSEELSFKLWPWEVSGEETDKMERRCECLWDRQIFKEGEKAYLPGAAWVRKCKFLDNVLDKWTWPDPCSTGTHVKVSGFSLNTEGNHWVLGRGIKSSWVLPAPKMAPI